MRHFLSLLLAFIVLLVPQLTFAQQQLVPDPELFEIQHFQKTCGRAEFGEGFATKLDVNNDKLMDLVINEGKITCAGEAAFYCNEDGCPYNFYVQVQEGGYVMIATVRMQGYDFVQRYGNHVLVMQMNPRFCDREGGDPCEVISRVRGVRFMTISKK